MGSAKKSANDSGSAARKARIEEMRRAERSRELRNRILTIGVSVVIVAGLVVGVTLLVKKESGGSDSVATGKGAGEFVTGADGVKTWNKKLTQNHVTKTVKYPMEPPVGGDHSQVWMNCNGDVYAKAINNMNAVHSLEHGAVWVTYNSKASKADIDALADKVKKMPYTLMSPDDEQADPIMLSAWGKQRTVTSATDPNVAKFFQEFVQGKQTPEPGAACTNGLAQ